MCQYFRENAALVQTSSDVDTDHSGSTFNGEGDVHWKVDTERCTQGRVSVARGSGEAVRHFCRLIVSGGCCGIVFGRA
jgi:hypothetical protein